MTHLILSSARMYDVTADQIPEWIQILDISSCGHLAELDINHLLNTHLALREFITDTMEHLECISRHSNKCILEKIIYQPSIFFDGYFIAHNGEELTEALQKIKELFSEEYIIENRSSVEIFIQICRQTKVV